MDEQTRVIPDGLRLFEIVRAEVFRGHPGGYRAVPDEVLSVVDLITNDGRVFLANRIGADALGTNSPMAHMAVGTMTTAASLNDSNLSGEIVRKALAVNTAATNNIYSAVATFGGAAESITSAQIAEAGVFNHAGSGQGILYQRIQFAAVTLADSDFLRVTMDTNVGSNTI